MKQINTLDELKQIIGEWKFRNFDNDLIIKNNTLTEVHYFENESGKMCKADVISLPINPELLKDYHIKYDMEQLAIDKAWGNSGTKKMFDDFVDVNDDTQFEW